VQASEGRNDFLARVYFLQDEIRADNRRGL